MKAGPIEIGRLLQNRNRFCVPIYQRHYVWTREKQWEPFWTDIRTKAIERLAGRERRFSHFMGAVVLETRGGFTAGQVSAFQVVDGQQRLTTFLLFLAAARDYATKLDLENTAAKITTYLLNDNPHLMEDAEVEIFKVWPTQYDRELFTDIINLGGREKLREKYLKHFFAKRDQIYSYRTVPPLLSAYGFFFDRICHAVETDDLDDEFTEAPETDESNSGAAPDNDVSREIKLDTIWQALVEEFKVVEIILDEGDDAQVIFETLNERGQPLLAADLVRNYVFYRADAAGENAEQLFRQYWSTFEDEDRFWEMEEKQGRYKKPRIEFFLSNFIAGQIAGEVNLSKLFSEYKAFVMKGVYPTVAAELQELARYGAIYREIIERSVDNALVRFSRRLLPWDVTTVFPLVMRLWATPSINDDEKAVCLETLLAFIVRRAVCGLTTKNYNKFFLSVVANLDKKGWSSDVLASFLLEQQSETGRFPRDNEFQEKWINTPVYKMLKSTQVRAILEEIEIAKRTRFHETKSLATHLSVEHVLPSQWKKTWPLKDGIVPTSDQIIQAIYSTTEDDSTIGRIIRRDRLKNTFGNLTLLTKPLNSSVSNAPFDEKRVALQEHSLLVLNREITKQSKWDEEKIIERGTSLFPLARDIWQEPRVVVSGE